MFTGSGRAVPAGRPEYAVRFPTLPNVRDVPRTRSRNRSRAGEHAWSGDACRRCGLRRREEWILDGAGHPVLALVWTDRYGDRQVQPFPRMLGLVPPARPTRTLRQAFPHLPIAPEPACEPAADDED